MMPYRALLAGILTVSVLGASPAVAVEENPYSDTDRYGKAKTGKAKTGKAKAGRRRAKSCPKDFRYSERKRSCVKIKTSCGAGQVWSGRVETCLDGNSAALTDDDLYLAAYDLGQQNRYAEALQLLFRTKNRQQPRVLNSIGYSTRKLGDIDTGIDYYHQALAVDPDYTKARQYLGEAYLQKDDVDKAKAQLVEIGERCGGPCEDYELLVNAIVAHVTGEEKFDW